LPIPRLYRYPLANVDDGNCVYQEDIPLGWYLLWNDEFNADEIDTNKWNHENWWPGYVNNELQAYSDAPSYSFLADGDLNIVMRRASPFDPNNPSYTSARMNTSGKGGWTYGRFEIKAKLPRGQGLWPAIWMMPTESLYGPWPVSGEIDIMEMLGHETDRVYGTIHYGDYYPNHSSAGTSYKLSSGNFADEFHVFALEWEEGSLRWYVNDILYQTRSTWFSVGGDWPAPFNQNFHIILNIALGGDWAGPPNANTFFPQTMLVDYVRVFQK
jgi:beta-glucanase (GH16 family)